MYDGVPPATVVVIAPFVPLQVVGFVAVILATKAVGSVTVMVVVIFFEFFFCNNVIWGVVVSQ